MKREEFLFNGNRYEIYSKLMEEKIPRNQILHWLTGHAPINSVAFLDSHPKYEWKDIFFYSACAYLITGDEPNDT